MTTITEAGQVTAKRSKLRVEKLAMACLGATGALVVMLQATGCAPANVEACKRYVVAQNAAYSDCGMPDRVKEEDETCPASLNEGIDCTDYYDRLAGSFECVAGEVTWDSTGSCT